MLLAASFQSLPIGSSPRNSEFPPIHWHADGEAMSPQSAHLTQETGLAAARGKVEGLHTVSTLQPGCLGSSVISARLNHLPGYLPPVFPGRMGTQGAVLRWEWKGSGRTHPLALIWGCTSLRRGDSSQACNCPHSPRFSFGSSDSWSKCVFLSLMMRASASRTTASLREAMRTNVSSLMGSSVWGAPGIPLSPSILHPSSLLNAHPADSKIQHQVTRWQGDSLTETA